MRVLKNKIDFLGCENFLIAGIIHKWNKNIYDEIAWYSRQLLSRHCCWTSENRNCIPGTSFSWSFDIGADLFLIRKMETFFCFREWWELNGIKLFMVLSNYNYYEICYYKFMLIGKIIITCMISVSVCSSRRQ